MAFSTFADARTALENNETSCKALVSSFLDRIASENPRLNAFLFVDQEGAPARARELDQRRAAGEHLPLAGLVLGVKDNICIKDWQATCGSHILEGFTSLYDATAVQKLVDAGAIVIGKTNCDAFGMGSSNENSYFGPVKNPLDEAYVSGGSSGGSAAAVAAGLCHAALGSDTGGSIRQPASFCGVVGLKPTYGRVSRYGLVAYASSFDCIGSIGHSVHDMAEVLEAMAGVDRWDATSAPVDVPEYTAALTGDVRGVRIGLPDEYFADGLDEGIRSVIQNAINALEQAGATIKPVTMPHTPYGVATYYVLATAEASSNLARFDGVRYGYRADLSKLGRSASLTDLYVESRTEGFGDEVKRRIMLGTYVLSSGYYDAYYGKAQRVRTLIRSDFDRAFEDVDMLLTPAAPTPPFKLGEKTDDPLAMYLGDIYTVTANLAGVPGLVVPAGAHPTQPQFSVGLQLLGRPFEEAQLLRVGDAVMKLV